MLVNIEEIDKDLFYSPSYEDDDSRPAEIYTFSPKSYPNLTQELNQFSNELYYRDNHRLIKNYTFLDFNNFEIASMWKRNNRIIAFATGYVRDCYPKNSIRILNRFYHDKSYSRVNFTRELLRPSTFHCVQQQILLAYRLGYDNAFISRELRAIKFFERFITALNQRSTHKWEYRKGPFLVSPDETDIKSWQSIGLTNLKYNDVDFWSYWKCKQS